MKKQTKIPKQTKQQQQEIPDGNILDDRCQWSNVMDRTSWNLDVEKLLKMQMYFRVF